MKNLICLLFTLLAVQFVYGQNLIKGVVVDYNTMEPINGALVSNGPLMVFTNAQGMFLIPATITSITIQQLGYEKKTFPLPITSSIFYLHPTSNELMQVVISANKTLEQKKDMPMSITSIGKNQIDEAKAQKLDVLLNKVSGVFVPTMGNEQHQMSIRQPMSLKGLFLYLEDGLPIRSTGVFSNNALIEMNMASMKQLEIIKGPASALYGGEAIGGAINIITKNTPAVLSSNFAMEGNNTGYKKLSAHLGNTLGKFGFLLNGYYANRINGPLEHSDFHKTAFTIKTDYAFNNRLKWSNALTYVDYYTDMPGPLDSINFSKQNFSSLQTFTYRALYALRNRMNLTMTWNNHSYTSLSYLYRNNAMFQNPTYLIASTKVATQFKGQINDNAFFTNLINLQHVQQFKWLKSKLIIGTSVDRSPQNYYAKYIAITKDLALNKFISYTAPLIDSFLRNYKTNIQNTATYLDYEIEPINHLKFVFAFRTDFYQYDFVNKLIPSNSTGAPNTKTDFQKSAPKLGFTYHHNRWGIYGNYAEGYVPPQITELYNTSSVPYLLPQSFTNKELGGWLVVLPNQLYFDWSAYLMHGSNEIIAVKSADGTTVNQNAGATKHMGIEYSVRYTPNTIWSLKWNASNASHQYIQYVLSGIDYSKKTMSAAPGFQSNFELQYKSNSIKGLRIGYEWQHQSKYFMDDLNKYSYKGFDVHNIRIGYQINPHFEAWSNLLNIFNSYYSVLATKTANTGSSSFSYYLGEPREWTIGIVYSIK